MNIIGAIAMIIITPVIEDFFHPEITIIKNKINAFLSHKIKRNKTDD